AGLDAEFEKQIENMTGPNLNQIVADQFFNTHSNKLGALSLCGTNTNIKCWAHYASQGKGYAIGIDPELQKVDDKAWRLDSAKYQQIEYVSEPPTFIFGNGRVNDNAATYTKLSSWEDEDEWRMVNRLENGIDKGKDERGIPIHLFDLRSEAIREIVFGYDISKDHIAEILDALKLKDLKHVKVFQATLLYADSLIKVNPF